MTALYEDSMTGYCLLGNVHTCPAASYDSAKVFSQCERIAGRRITGVLPVQMEGTESCFVSTCNDNFRITVSKSVV